MQKRETWTADPAWFDNVHVQGGEGLWGYFNFRHQSHRQALRAYCNAQGIDVVIANPAFGLGAPGSGRPDETQRFVDEFLRDVGLWDDLAIVLLHHSGKSGNVSGDWGRQPDPEIELQRDGDKPRTRIIWHKVWESDEAAERPKRQLLDWVPQHKGFTLSDADLSGHVPDDEYLARIDAFLHAHPGANTKSVRSGVKGDGTRIVGLLREGADQGRYLMQEGAHGAKCWRLAGESPA